MSTIISSCQKALQDKVISGQPVNDFKCMCLLNEISIKLDSMIEAQNKTNELFERLVNIFEDNIKQKLNS